MKLIGSHKFREAGLIQPANCSHKEKQLKQHIKQCEKCGRYRVSLPEEDLFFYATKVKYLTRKK